ncbi:MAG: asparagine synthase C-terminal domain-containing protein [Azoarcus sp.]|nr:asparagine synthase C-terminal domain-containing protein [Azoarcus sp.]
MSCLDGHFSFIVVARDFAVLAVDRTRSIPVLLAERDGTYVIADHAAPLLKALDMGTGDIDGEAARDFAMAGYVVGNGTLYRNIRSMQPGEIALIRRNGKLEIFRHASYHPWLAKTVIGDEGAWRKKLAEITLGIIEKMMISVSGRQILLPLSAGLDSRLIVSALKHLGARDVVCFSYGRAGNHEADTARQVAEKIGFQWHFIPCTPGLVRQKRAEEDFSRFLSLSDNLVSTPVEQDVSVVMSLRDQPWADKNAVIVNGQSGDYISGAHIPPMLAASLPMDREAREAVIFSAIHTKHLGLWPGLKTSENLSRVKARLWAELEEEGAPLDVPELAFSIYEFSEFRNRQCKYVLGNQRGYEVFGRDWRLPLWDGDYLDFWQEAPLPLKFGQRLYREMLVEANWGGVWNTLVPAPCWITPAWIRPLRYCAMAACAPFGKNAWHRLETRLFNPLTDIVCTYAAVPYWKVVTGPAHRNAISWLTAQHLERHGLPWNGGRDGRA